MIQRLKSEFLLTFPWVPSHCLERKEREGWRPGAGMCGVWGSAPLEYRTGTNLLKPVGVQGHFTNAQPIRKCFEKHLLVSLMGWGGNSGDASVTKERDCGRTAMPLVWKGSTFRKSHASHSKHTARRPPVHSRGPRRNDDDVPKEWPSDHSMPFGLKHTSWFTPLPGLLQTRLLRATFSISHSANTLLVIRSGLCQALWSV